MTRQWFDGMVVGEGVEVKARIGCGYCASRGQGEDESEGEEVEPCAERDEDGVEEAGGQDPRV